MFKFFWHEKNYDAVELLLYIYEKLTVMFITVKDKRITLTGWSEVIYLTISFLNLDIQRFRFSKIYLFPAVTNTTVVVLSVKNITFIKCNTLLIFNKMKKAISLAAAVFVMISVSAQDQIFLPPDYLGIKGVMSDSSSVFYYPGLLDRYQRCDTTLNMEDFRVLYYGNLFTGSYSPYARPEKNDTLTAIFTADTVTADDFRTIIRFENKVLEEFPFSIWDLSVLSFSYHNTGDSVQYKNTSFKLNMIIRTILSTGDGMTEKTGWHVIYVDHEYDLLNLLGLSFGGDQMLTTGGCDYLKVNPNEFDIEGLYFDVNQILEKETELLSPQIGPLLDSLKTK